MGLARYLVELMHALYYWASRAFARRIHVSFETIRNWEHGKRCPTGAARALLRVLDKVPETALRILT